MRKFKIFYFAALIFFCLIFIIVPHVLSDFGPVRLKIHVFFDRDKDGVKDKGDYGAGGVSVRLNERKCVTDSKGNCEFMIEGHGTSVKHVRGEIISESLPRGTIFTGKKNFEAFIRESDIKIEQGVYFPRKQFNLLSSPALRLRVNSYFVYDRVRISGNINKKEIKVNNKKINYPGIDCIFEGSGIVPENYSAFLFRVKTKKNSDIKSWKFIISTADGKHVIEKSGFAKLPPSIHWNGKDFLLRPVSGDKTFRYSLVVIFSNFDEIISPVRAFSVAGNSPITVKIDKSQMKRNIILNKTAKLRHLLLKKSSTVLVLRGSRIATGKVERIIRRNISVDADRITSHVSLSVPAGAVIANIYSVSEDPKSVYEQKIIIEGKKYNTFGDGSFNFFVRDIPVSKKLKIDVFSNDGSRAVLNVEMPESEILKSFSYSDVVREFSNVNTGGDFKFNYSVLGSYSRNYRLYDSSGKLLDNRTFKSGDKLYDAKGIIIKNRLDTVINISPEIGLNSFPFVLVNSRGEKIDVTYIVDSLVLETQSKRPFLSMKVPFEETLQNDYMFMSGNVNPGADLYIKGGRADVDESGNFYHTVFLPGYKNKINMGLRLSDGRMYSAGTFIKKKKSTFLEKIKLRAGFDTNVFSLSQDENTSLSGYAGKLTCSIEARAAIFPLNSVDLKKFNFYGNPGLSVSYERAILPFTISEGGTKKTPYGPEWMKLRMLFDLSDAFFQFEPELSVGYGFYKYNINEPGFFYSVDEFNKFFIGIDAGYREYQTPWYLRVGLMLDYYIPSNGRSGFEAGLSLSKNYCERLLVKMGYKYRRYSLSDSSLKVNETYSGYFAGLRFSY